MTSSGTATRSLRSRRFPTASSGSRRRARSCVPGRPKVTGFLAPEQPLDCRREARRLGLRPLFHALRVVERERRGSGHRVRRPQRRGHRAGPGLPPRPALRRRPLAGVQFQPSRACGRRSSLRPRGPSPRARGLDARARGRRRRPLRRRERESRGTVGGAVGKRGRDRPSVLEDRRPHAAPVPGGLRRDSRSATSRRWPAARLSDESSAHGRTGPPPTVRRGRRPASAALGDRRRPRARALQGLVERHPAGTAHRRELAQGDVPDREPRAGVPGLRAAPPGTHLLLLGGRHGGRGRRADAPAADDSPEDEWRLLSRPAGTCDRPASTSCG